jgi:hypothetical protein
MRAEWQYGLPELHRGAIAGACQVANPGCYATAAILALAPVVAAGLVEPDLVVDGKSGVSGAGKSPTERNSFWRRPRASLPTSRSATTTSSRSKHSCPRSAAARSRSHSLPTSRRSRAACW